MTDNKRFFLDAGKKYKPSNCQRDESNKLYETSQRLFDTFQIQLNNGNTTQAEYLLYESEIALTKAEKLTWLTAKEIFRYNNPNKFSNILDFQGLYIEEGIKILKSILIESIGIRNEVKCVVSKKKSISKVQIGKLGPLIEQLCQDSSLISYSDRKDEGTIIIDLRGTIPSQIPQDWIFEAQGNVNHIPVVFSLTPKTFWEKAWAGYGTRFSPAMQRERSQSIQN